jgi:hypothetical protein
MNPTDVRSRPRARWVATATATLLLLALLPLAGVAVAAVPEQLGFNPEPGGAIKGGEAFPTQPKVEVQDASDDLVTSDNTTVVTLAIASAGAAGASLQCTDGNSRTVVAGVATFAGCKIDKAGSGYVLVATSSPAYESDDSNPFNVTVGPAAKLAFTQQPIGGVGIGDALPQQPTVTIQDAGGNTITGPAGDLVAPVALTIAPLTPTVGGPGVLACDSLNVSAGNDPPGSETATPGVAKFTGCKIDTNSGAGYKLRATATVSTGTFTADSAVFVVNVVVAGSDVVKLAFKTQPGGGTGGTAWSQQPVVQVQNQNASNNVVTQDGSTIVTLALTTSPAVGATLSCTGGLSKVVTYGQATFEGCKIDKVAVGYAITASDTTGTGLPHPYASAHSDPFSVAVGAVAQLGFTAEPGASAAGAAFSTQPVVAIQDAGGNTVTTAPVTAVTLAIGTNPGGGVLSCTSGNSRSTLNGVATFSGCSISTPGTGYKLSAAASGLSTISGTAFNVTSAASLITLVASAGIVNQLEPVTLTAQFASSGPSRQVTLEKKSALDSDWVTVAVLTTDLAGRTTAQITPTNTASYRVSFAGAADLSPGTSNVVSVSVRYIVTLAPRTSTGSSTVARGTKTTYTATVRPIYSGQRVSFQIYKWVGGAWVFQTSATKTANASGQATFTWTWSKSGKWYMRARANSTPMNTTAFSNLEKVTVP